MIPIKNSAGCTAFVFHYPFLERTEKQYAYHIHDGEEQTDDEYYLLVDDVCIVQQTDDCRRKHGDECHGDCRVFFVGDDVFFGHLAGFEVAPELLLAAHALQSGGEEAQEYLHNKNRPYDSENYRPVRKNIKQIAVPHKTVGKIRTHGAQKQQTAKTQLEIVDIGYERQNFFCFFHIYVLLQKDKIIIPQSTKKCKIK